MEENTSNFKCQLCDRVFDGLDLLNLHLRVAHNMKDRVGNSVLSVTKFNCDICKKSFSTNGMLSRHVESKICQKTFEKVPEKQMLPQFKCGSCVNSFWDSYTLKKHFESVHLKLKKHICDICEMSFGTKDNLVSHSKIHKRDMSDNLKDIENIFDAHIKIEEDITFSSNNEEIILAEESKSLFKSTLECEQCQKTFTEKYKLRRHQDTVHLKLKPYKCDHCGKCFGERYSLTKHIKNVHNNIKDYQCIECDQFFSKKISMLLHQEKIHKMFYNVVGKIQASEIKSEPISINECKKFFPCSSCGKEFSRKDKLNIHYQAVHLNLKPYKCSSCNESFGRKHSLKRHHIRFHQKKFQSVLIKNRMPTDSIGLQTNELIEKQEIKNEIVEEPDESIESETFEENHYESIFTETKMSPSQNQTNSNIDETQEIKKEMISESDESINLLTDFKCIECEKYFSSHNSVKRHHETVHLKLKPHICVLCNKGFGEKSEMKKHIQKVHEENDQEQNQCFVCYLFFAREFDLIQHLKEAHYYFKDNKCDICGKTFSRKVVLKIHKDISHHEPLDIKNEQETFQEADCLEYDAEANSSNSSYEEITVKEEMDSFESEKTETENLEMPHNASDTSTDCKECGKYFRDKNKLKRHVETVHLKLKPYKCETCNKSFGEKSHMKRHVKNTHEML